VRFVDLNRRWPFADGHVAIVYASHVYEHLSGGAAALFLREAWRCLEPGGALRVVVPDLQTICRQYLAELDAGDEQASKRALDSINMHREGQYRADDGIAIRLIAAWQHHPHQHKYMYDAPTLRARLSAAGFVELRAASYGQSAFIAEIRDVEGTAAEPYPGSVYLEARRPHGATFSTG
jgi:SAM-dependent methyltransferase